MEPNKPKSSQTSHASGSSAPSPALSPPTLSTKPTLGQQILRSLRGKPSAANGAAYLPLAAALPPITTTALKTPSNPFDNAAPNNDPISPISLSNVDPALPNEYETHFSELRGPLPSSQAARDEAIKDKIPRLRALNAAVQRQTGPFPDYSNDVPLAEVFKLCTELLTAEQPQSLRIEACNLLTSSVKLADQRAASASKAISESRSGAPGSLSSKVPDSDQPLADIDRALFYRLVLTLSANELDDFHGDTSKAILGGLSTQLRALEVLTKDGRDVVGFPDLLLSLTQWLAVAWKEVQTLRAECRRLEQQRERHAENLDRGSMEQHQKAEIDIMAKLSAVEWDVQATLHLLTSILKYSFPRIPLAHAEMALRSAATMVLGEPPDRRALRQHVGSPSLKATTLTGPFRARGRAMGPNATSRSKSRDTRPLVDGYSYYGLETITPSSGSEESSPAMTPRQSTRPEGAPLPSLSASISAAPITLATIAPSRDPSVSQSNYGDGPDANWFFGPELHPAEVRSVLKMMDATLRYGYLPPKCVDIIVRMLCRLLGYPLVDASAPGMIARHVSGEDQSWRAEAWPIFSHILRSHCANAAIRAVRQLLVEPDEKSPAQQTPEDPAVLVGALSFFRSAMAHIAQYETEKQQSHSSNVGSNKPQAEDALAPALSLSLIMPALRGALRRQSDLLDLEVLNLVADLLPSKPGSTSESADAARPGSSAIKRVVTNAFTSGDWDALLDLTVEARRHVEGWRLRGAALNPFSAQRESDSRTRSTGNSDEPSLAVHAMIGVLSRLYLAPPPRSVEEGEEEPASTKVPDKEEHQSLPWTPKLASLLLSLAPILPDDTVVDLVRYYRSQHLCLPSNPDWITNIRALLQAFYHRHEQMLEQFGAKPAPEARRRLGSLLFDHVYGTVQDTVTERNLFMTEIILPLASSTLSSESDPYVESEIRRVLVTAAVLSGSDLPGPIDPEVEQEPEPVREAPLTGDGFDPVFVQVRQLLCRTARAGSFQSSSSEATRQVASDGRAGHAVTSPSESTSASISLDAKASNAALDLISIFNRMAFSSPWIASSVDPSFDKAVRKKWGKQTRAACIAIYRDLLELLRPTTLPSPEESGDKGAFVPPSKRGDTHVKFESTPASSSTSAASVRTRLIILEWFVRLRTDRQHRVYLVEDMDELTISGAKLLGKGPRSEEEERSSPDALNEPSASTERSAKAVSSARTEREGRDAQRGNEAVNRSKSRVRELSRERGRERTNDSPRRQAERDRSASQNRKPAAAHDSIWRLPIKVSFEMPEISLRSDIIYTYIHEAAEPAVTLTEGEALPAPLPVSEFLATCIAIMNQEREWELLSYLICHLPHQLANKHLFSGPKAQVQVVNLRRTLCEGILRGDLFPHVLLPDNIKKTDVFAVVYNMLTVLLGYRTLFSRPEQDEMVEAFIAGLNKSQNTAQPCVRALSVACYELQKSFSRMLSGMLVRLSTVMSSMTMSVHILELIMSVGHIPACYANLTEADHRRVFGIALQYIQYHQSSAAATRDDWRSNPASFSLSQYVMMMAYYNISLWFMTLKISDRPKHVPYISRGLLLANEGMEKLSDQTEVCFDFLARYTHSNADPKPKRSFINNVIMGAASIGPGKPKDANRQSKTWLMGKGLLTVTTLKREGWVEILVRRPSGTASMLCKLENVPVSMLPDENGEQIDLPAALMMNRSPDVLRAPKLLAPEWSTEGFPKQRSLRERAEERLRLSEQLSKSRPLGPSHFGLARKPRAASFSGPISEPIKFGPLGEDNSVADPYKQPTGESQEAGELSKKIGNRGESDAMREVMREILSEDGPSSNDPEAGSKQTSSSAQPGIKPAASSAKASKDAGVDPGFVALQLSSFPDMVSDNAPILLPEEPATDRMIRAVDLTPVVDFHKIGVLYVGPGQEKETDILGNRHGSPAYMRFLSGLGHLITLKGQEDVYTGGLDRESDEHGKYAYVWTDDISQIVYHTATLMPNRPHDANHAMKKALIGNDWVHIVFNESGKEYKFGTIPSQFNYVNVCISPNSRGGANLGSAAPDDAVFCKLKPD